ncbi:DNA-binding protein [Cupriavidus sp. IDO]|uniref:DNA-binding protein n=1 Tax=Cupriavidus sp. IDO TaxID=1539142 RepID=UPI001EE6C1E9|nr:DNA-binding protein [Cupriavidus sp. IDO]
MTIDHPGLPDALKSIAADTVQAIWQVANEAAAGDLAALRAEARLQASEAEAQRDQARAAVVVAEQEKVIVEAELEAAQRASAVLQRELDAARQAHAAAQARHEEGRRQVEALERQLQELRTQFSTELERTREQVWRWRKTPSWPVPRNGRDCRPSATRSACSPWRRNGRWRMGGRCRAACESNWRRRCGRPSVRKRKPPRRARSSSWGQLEGASEGEDLPTARYVNLIKI